VSGRASHAIDLPTEPDPDLAADLEKQGGYVSPHVRRVQIVGRTVRYEADAGAPADVHEKMRRYLHAMSARHRKLPRRVLLERARSSARPLERDAFAGLVDRGWARPAGSGRVALSGPALRALRAVDEDARRRAVTVYGAREEAYPTLIATHALARCGYLSSFPQSLSVVTHLVEDFDVIEDFRRAHEVDPALRTLEPGTFVAPPCCLSPAVCYHCYLGLEGQRLTEGPAVVTAAGKCFRYESINMVGLDRLWDFTMREIVFVGTEDDVLTHRARGLELAAAQLEAWDLAGHVETANDPFFSAAYAGKSYAQLRGELKYELRLDVAAQGDAAPRTLACASFNLHDNFFGRTFSIEASDGAPAFTGCIGWGLERWVLALFAQHGFEPADWPPALRDAVWA